MYTGIVRAVVPVTRITQNAGFRSFELDFPPEQTTHLDIGASVSVEGVCLSVTAVNGTRVSFDAMDATLGRTNLGALSEGETVNIERSAKMTDENGGHVVSGHVSCAAELVEIHTDDDGALIRFRVAPEWGKYIFPRGFLAVNGCSLTVAEAEGDLFTIYLIPETLRQTSFRRYVAGDRVNIEVEHQTMVTVDVIERTLENLLPRYLGSQVA